MSTNVFGRFRALTYAQARRLVVAAGVVLLALIAAVMYARRVETVEVVAVLMFVPVFLSFVLWDVAGGLVAGVAASAAYVGMRWSAIHAVGAGRFTGLVVWRVLGFVVFGGVGGWANRQLRASLSKLDLYDQIDDATGLFNARFFVQDTDLELARARRYKTLFAVCVLDVPTAPVDALARRSRDRLLRELGRLLAAGVRSVDRAVHGRDGNRHRLAVVLPETGPEGARVFASRLATTVRGFLLERGVDVDGLEPRAIAFPDDETALATLRDEFSQIDRDEHPA